MKRLKLRKVPIRKRVMTARKVADYVTGDMYEVYLELRNAKYLALYNKVVQLETVLENTETRLKYLHSQLSSKFKGTLRTWQRYPVTVYTRKFPGQEAMIVELRNCLRFYHKQFKELDAAMEQHNNFYIMTSPEFSYAMRIWNLVRTEALIKQGESFAFGYGTGGLSISIHTTMPYYNEYGVLKGVFLDYEKTFERRQQLIEEGKSLFSRHNPAGEKFFVYRKENTLPWIRLSKPERNNPLFQQARFYSFRPNVGTKYEASLVRRLFEFWENNKTEAMQIYRHG